MKVQLDRKLISEQTYNERRRSISIIADNQRLELARRAGPRLPPAPDPAAMTRIAASLPEITDEKLRHALARLGAAMEHD